MQHIEAFIGASLPKNIHLLLELRRLWQKVVTEDIAKETSIASFKNGSLKIIVHDNIWNEELKYLKAELFKRLNDDEEVLNLTENNGINNLIFKFQPKQLQGLEEPNEERERNCQYQLTEHIRNYIEKSSEKISSEKIRKSYIEMLEERFRHEDFYEWINRH